MTPLVPPVTFVAPTVCVGLGVVTSKDIMHPNPGKLNGQFMAGVTCALPVTLKKIKSVPFGCAPRLVLLELKNSVTGEQGTLAVVSVGPAVAAVGTPAVMVICHSAVIPALVLQTYMFPVPPAEV